MPRFAKFFTWKRSDCCRHCLDFTNLAVAIIILHFLGNISSVWQRPFKRLKKKEKFQKAFASLGDTSISLLTIFLSGLGAIFEFDLKKVIALSTLRPLGVINFSLSIRLRKYDFFHLLTHATFKSIIFICAGIIIHNIQD